MRLVAKGETRLKKPMEILAELGCRVAERPDDSHSAFVANGRGGCGVTDVLCLRHTAETAVPPNRQSRPRATSFVPFVFSCQEQKRTKATKERRTAR